MATAIAQAQPRPQTGAAVLRLGEAIAEAASRRGRPRGPDETGERHSGSSARVGPPDLCSVLWLAG
eukprot:6213523-Pleurochrysis_carterae.AAC.2